MLFFILRFISIIIIFYILLIMPKIVNKPDLSGFMNVYYTHRGFHKEKHIAPENSLAAFSLAVQNNFGIEFDVQLSKDGIPVIFHDFDLSRVCGVDKNVSELTFSQLRELNLFDSREKIPHLKELLDLVNGQVPLIVEIKPSSNDMSVCSVVASYLDDYKGIYCVESFNPLAVLWYKRNRPQVIRGQLSMNYLRDKRGQSKLLSFLLQYLLFNFLTKPNFIAYNYKYHNNLSLILCRKLYDTTTIAYTIPSRSDLELYFNRFDLFIFENFIPNN